MMKNNITSNWIESKLGDLCDIILGRTPKRDQPKYWGGNNPWVAIADLNNGILENIRENITDEGIESSRARKICKGTLLFSFKLTIGKLAIAGKDLFTNEAIAALPIKDASKIDKNFLFYALQVADLLRNVGEASKGATLNKKTIPLIQICHPKNIYEQRTIVLKIEEIIHRIHEIANLTKEKEIDLENLIHSIYYEMIQNVEWEPLRNVATFIRRKIQVIPNENYEEMGIRSFGKGTFKKPTLTGKQIGNKQIYQIAKGDLVFNNVFAWEGAVAVAQAEDEGRVGSHRFITYKPIEKKATAEFLYYHFLSQIGLETLGNASPGSAGRNRTLGLEKLAKIKVPVPPFEKQVLFSQLVNRKQEITKLSEEIKKEIQILIRATLAKAFRGEL